MESVNAIARVEVACVDSFGEVLDGAVAGDSDVIVCFFFQAEDGIRDLTVTGVQTCALPISQRGDGADMTFIAKPKVTPPSLPKNALGLTRRDYEGALSTLCAGCGHDSITAEIGRASCRERV